MSVVNIEMCPSLRQAYHNDNFEDSHCTESAVLTIEEIKMQLYSCFTCGVCWLQDHVCLDCAECGGYSLQRPCPQCDGKCASVWKRDLTMSHACGKARWNGNCQLQNLSSSLPVPEKTQNQPKRLSSNP